VKQLIETANLTPYFCQNQNISKIFLKVSAQTIFNPYDCLIGPTPPQINEVFDPIEETTGVVFNPVMSK
jgi:hypothetical protein